MSDRDLFCIILAAGHANRFGSTKQLARIGATTLVERAIRCAESVCGRQTLLVAGHEHSRVIAAAGRQSGFFIVNETPQAGIGSSIALAARSLSDVAGGILILLADQPLIGSANLQPLLVEWRANPRRIVASGFGDNFGPPVIFPPSCFAALAELTGDRGARQLIAERPELATIVPCDAAGVDVDRPEDLKKIQPV